MAPDSVIYQFQSLFFWNFVRESHPGRNLCAERSVSILVFLEFRPGVVSDELFPEIFGVSILVFLEFRPGAQFVDTYL